MGHRKLGTIPILLTLGLYSDDIISEEMKVVQEALNRITDKEMFDRTFRIRRAMQLDLTREELPKEEWIKAETDVPYLWKHIVNICHEKQERKKYDKLDIKPPKNYIS